jgi:hypothetical protein
MPYIEIKNKNSKIYERQKNLRKLHILSTFCDIAENNLVSKNLCMFLRAKSKTFFYSLIKKVIKILI